MAKAKKLPSGSWRCLVYSHTEKVLDPKTGQMKDKRIYESFTDDDPGPRGKRRCEAAAAAWAAEKEQRGRSKKTFGEAFDEYIALREPVLSPRTIRDYRYIREHAIQSIMGVMIDDITQQQIQQIINEDAKIHAPKTVHNHHGVISAVLKQERPSFALNTVLPKSIRPELNIPIDTDVMDIISAATGTELEIPILLAAFGPMRRGEICALTSDCISGNVVHVKYNMVLNPSGEWVIKSPKSYRGDRYIEFPDEVMAKLDGISGRVTMLNPDALTCRFRRLVKKVGGKQFRLHDLRHYSASIMHTLGIPDAYIMERGGWQTDTVLKSIYRHTMDDKKKEINERANLHFTAICNTKCNTQQKNP